MIAKIMLPIPVGRPFDYLVPEEMKSRIRKGMRVCVPFCRRQRMGYVVGFSSRSAVKGLRSIGALPDNVALLGRTEFAIAEYIAASYFCSLGQALELTLPLALRKGRRVDTQDCPLPEDDAAEEAPGEKGSVFLLQGLSCARWRFYRDKIAAALSQGRRAIVLCPDIDACRRMQAWLEKEFKVAPSLLQGRLGPRRELEEWLRIKRGKADIVLGTCSAVFVPLRRLGLIIVEQEQEAVYKQEQSPFYDARDVAVFRGRQAGADVVLSSNVPTLESYYLARKGRYRLVAPGQEGPPDPAAQVVEMKDEYYRRGKRRVVISSILENAVRNTLREGRRVVLFLNRVGFSTYALCRGCGFIIRCQHCSNNLTYIFASRSLVCRSCNFSIRPPERCPRCNAAYIRYLGLGTEKLESEACRLFPKARVERYDRLRRLDLSKERFDILVATQIILNDPDNLKGVGLLGLVDMDVSLNHIDFRAAEKTFQVVSRLLSAVYRPRQGHDFSGGGENGAGPQGEGC
ncbi:MAG: primosomal protein N', partial [Candidatus Omnitrophota bacterium]